MTRRERLRDATLREIKGVAREQLRAHGPSGISLRAIARDMDMTAPALYRYYASLDDLVHAMIEDYKNEVSDALEAARDAVPADDVGGRLMAVAREFRRWALSHRPEFTLVFGGPVSGSAPPDERANLGGMRFGGIYLALYAELWQRRPFPVPADEAIPDELRNELRRFADSCGGQQAALPLGLLRLFVSAWVRLYGLVTMEVFGHGRFMVSNAEPLFEAELADIAESLGVATRPVG